MKGGKKRKEIDCKEKEKKKNKGWKEERLTMKTKIENIKSTERKKVRKAYRKVSDRISFFLFRFVIHQTPDQLHCT